MGAINFRPYVKVYLKENESSVILCRPFTDNNIGKVYELTEVGIFLFKQIGKGLTQTEITETVLARYPGSHDEISSIFEVLLSEKYIEIAHETTNPIYLDLEREYGRLLPIWSEFESEELTRYQIQLNLMNKKVGVIGCGTIGFGIVSKLVVSGVTNFVLFDSDVVEETNLARQTLFSLDDIGIAKTECVKRFILSRKRHATVRAFNKTIQHESDLDPLKDVDIVVVAGDTPSYQELGLLVQEYCFKRNIPISFAGGYRAHIGKIYPLVIPNKTACFHCLTEYFAKDVEEVGERIVNQEVKVSTTVQMGDFITSIVSFEITKFLTGAIPPLLINKMMLLDLSEYKTTDLAFERSPHCPFCSKVLHNVHE